MSAIAGSFVKIATIGGMSTIRLTIDVDIAEYGKVCSILGAPDGKWVGIAPINPQQGVKLARTEELEAEGTDYLPSPPKHPLWGKFYQRLVLSNFFNNSNVLEKLGTDEQYLAWVRTQVSAHSVKQDWIDGVGCCEAAHVRRVNLGAGTAIKPKFAAIPLTHDEHKQQTDAGESAIAPKEQWDKWLSEHRLKWGKMRLKQYFKVDSLSELDPHTFKEWCVNNGLMLYVPRELATEKE